MSSYTSADSPKGGEAERYSALVQETSKAVAQFNQVTRSIAQKMSLFGTPQDSRANHRQLTELSERGNKLVGKINRRLEELGKGTRGPGGRARKTQVSKLQADYKKQLVSFEETCQKLLEHERAAVDHIRRSSSSFRSPEGEKPAGFGDYNEDQIYSQANVVNYDEDDLQRREEDIVQINQQLREVNAAFQEVDGLVTDQGEVVVDIEQDAEDAHENASGALHNVREANMKRGLCKCSKTKLICIGIFALVVAVVIVAVVTAVK